MDHNIETWLKKDINKEISQIMSVIYTEKAQWGGSKDAKGRATKKSSKAFISKTLVLKDP